MEVNQQLSFGEYMRRARRAKDLELQQVAAATGLSLSHLSRIENDRAIPSPDTVVKLASALDADLNRMLELADCLPQEILERLSRRAEGSGTVYRRAAGNPEDPEFAQDLVDDMDPQLRAALAQRFGLRAEDADGLFTALCELAGMESSERRRAIDVITVLLKDRGKA